MDFVNFHFDRCLSYKQRYRCLRKYFLIYISLCEVWSDRQTLLIHSCVSFAVFPTCWMSIHVHVNGWNSWKDEFRVYLHWVTVYVHDLLFKSKIINFLLRFEQPEVFSCWLPSYLLLRGMSNFRIYENLWWYRLLVIICGKSTEKAELNLEADAAQAEMFDWTLTY